MSLKWMGYVSTRLAVGALVLVAGMSAPAFAKKKYKRVVSNPAIVQSTTHDDRFPWLDQGYAPTAQVTKRQSRKGASQNTFGTSSFGGSGLVAEARRYLGTNPTGRARLWCARFLNMVLERSGKSGTGSDMASSFAAYGSRVSGPQIGAIAVMSRGKRGGHVGIVSGIDESGNPIIISGNHGRTVAEATYPRGRIYAYVMP